MAKKKWTDAFQIGDVVRVKAKLVSHVERGYRRLRRDVCAEPYFAVITGASHRQEGKVNHATGGGWDGEYEPGYLTVEKTHRVWLFRRGLLNKECTAAAEDLEKVDPAQVGFTVPSRAEAFNWSEQDKAEMRNIMKDHPREANGRWKKVT